MARERKSYPANGIYFHREHRSKRKRKPLKLKEETGRLFKKKKLEEIKIKELEYERIGTS